jgi:F-type H+-transporting ATPase subunit a
VLIGLVSQNGWIMGCVVLAVGILLAVLWAGKSKKILHWIVAGITIALGLFGLLEGLGILSGVPIFAYGIPGVLSLYFDLFSGFIQALVFTMLSMVYIAGSLPGPEEAKA